METHDALSKPTFFLESEKALASFLNHPSNIENGKKKQNISRKTKSAFGAPSNGTSCKTKKKQSKSVGSCGRGKEKRNAKPKPEKKKKKKKETKKKKSRKTKIRPKKITRKPAYLDADQSQSAFPRPNVASQNAPLKKKENEDSYKSASKFLVDQFSLFVLSHIFSK